MDNFSYYAAAPQAQPQPFDFLPAGFPPTPTHTGSANSDEYGHSPPDAFEYQNFDRFNQPYSAGGPQPKPPTPQSQNGLPSLPHPSQTYENNNSDINDDATRRGGSNSDDDENMTPAQSRRKAQNRAAQRAFRERKERHVKDLESKLAALEATTNSMAEENARLKIQLQKTSTENEILKATSQSSSQNPQLPNAGPMRFSPTDFYTEVLYQHENKVPSHKIVVSENGERLFAAGAAWDYITRSEEFKRGIVDVMRVSEKLKQVAKCDGQGPVFEEGAIVRAIRESVMEGNDELL